jgi:hypothetical protein
LTCLRKAAEKDESQCNLWWHPCRRCTDARRAHPHHRRLLNPIGDVPPAGSTVNVCRSGSPPWSSQFPRAQARFNPIWYPTRHVRTAYDTRNIKEQTRTQKNNRGSLESAQRKTGNARKTDCLSAFLGPGGPVAKTPSRRPKHCPLDIALSNQGFRLDTLGVQQIKNPAQQCANCKHGDCSGIGLPLRFLRPCGPAAITSSRRPTQCPLDIVLSNQGLLPFPWACNK